MELKLERENAAASVRVLDTEVTQAAEHDFYLPDYCPDIFRVLRCSMDAGVTSTAISGGKLSFDLAVVMRVIYRSPDSGGVYCVEHTQEYTKTLDLPPDTVSPQITVIPAVQNVNCRAADKRRLEVRGSIICKVTADGERLIPLVKNAAGCGIQLKKEQVIFPTKRLSAAKRITVIEELELAEGKPEFGSVLNCSVSVERGEQRVISGKLVAGGEARVNLLYLPKGDGVRQPETMRFSIPFSQVIGIDGLDEGFETEVDITAAKCALVPKSDGVLECELVLLVGVTAQKFETVELVTDAYSTRCETECIHAEGAVITPVERSCQPCSVTGVLTCSEGEPSKVCDVWCEGLQSFFRTDEETGKSVVYGKAVFCMLAFLADGTAVYCEREVPFEQENEGISAAGGAAVNVSARVKSCSYSMGEGGTVTAKAELELCAAVRRVSGEGLVTDITADETRPKQTDSNCAVRICYSGDGGERLWDIAKRYSADSQAHQDENPQTGGRRTLIIPIK